ncbi:hypothetical protein JCM10213_001237 [Rhodosporidiobolus nylandii]
MFASGSAFGRAGRSLRPPPAARPRSTPSSSFAFSPLRTAFAPSSAPRTPLARRWASTGPSNGPASQPGSAQHARRQASEAYNRARQEHHSQRNRSLALYSAATIFVVGAASYLAVPLYRVFCSATGYNGTPTTDPTKFSPERLVARTDLGHRIRVTFNADSSDALPWSFEPQQKEVRVLPGETALAFYTAKNHSDEDIIGIATYNVTPGQIAPYFAKVECFCFEEQRILAGEEVDLPVFFFIDRDYVDDPLMKDVTEVTLSYTFFRARRDKYGNLVPSEGPLAVADSVPAV